MSHDRFHDRLLELAYGELSPREAREVEAHAESCAECGAELGRIRATRRIMGALPDERAPDAGERILLAAAREAARDRKPRGLLPTWAWSASVVAALVVAVGAVSYRLLALRPAAERPGEELLGRAQYAEPPSTPTPAPTTAPAQDDSQAEPSPTAAPPPARAAPPARVAKRPAPSPGKRQAPAGAREERAEGKAAPALESPAAEGRAFATDASPARKAQESRAAEADVEVPAAPEELAGFAEPPSRTEEAPSRSDVATSRSRSAGAPAAASAPAPRALAAPASPAAPDRSGVALARYSALRAAGSLSGEIRTFTGCEGESWRKVERDREGRTVKYVREGRVAGRRVRVEHLFGADGELAAVRVTDLDRGGADVSPDALGLSLPRDASEAGPDAEARCGH